MSFFDDYKKRINIHGSNFVNAKKKINSYFYNSKFKDSPSYRQAILNGDESKLIDLRLINSDKLNIKRASLKPDEILKDGDMLYFDDKHWLVLDCEENLTSPQAEIRECNKTLNYLGLDRPIPCCGENALFYTLGQLDNDRFSHPDGKVNIYVQASDKTRFIYEGMRFIFNGLDCFTVTFVDRTTREGWFEITMKQTATLPEDDFENNIAYNPALIEKYNKENLNIKGASIIEFNSKATYEVNSSDSFKFTLNNNDLAVIEDVDKNQCTILTNNISEYVILKAVNTSNPSLQAEKYIFIREE